MIDVLSYIKSLFFSVGENRKRRAPPGEFDIPTTSKIRRISTSQMSNILEDDWHSLSSTSSMRRQASMNNFALGTKPKPNSLLKENITVNIDDDDDDILEVSKPKSHIGRHFTSTPNYGPSRMSRHGDDDVTLLKCTQSSEQKKLDAKKQGFDYIKPFSYLSTNNVREQNGAKPREIIPPTLRGGRDIKARLGLNRQPMRSSALDQSFRLDEKFQYKQLLAKIAPNSATSYNAFSKYNVPSSKLFSSGSSGRGKKILSMLQEKSKPSTIIDLTFDTNGTDKMQSRLTTKETIMKVLDKYDNESVVIKDSDSDVEILPTPPSPKPDIKVERINSLKKILDTTETTNEEWLKTTIEKYRDSTLKHEKQISEQTAQKEKLAAITSGLHAKRLESQMVKFLKIRDAVLPIEVSEETVFPELTDKDDARIDYALNERKNLNEVLSSKFNLNITRRDLMTLSGLNWLNDEVINFYMNLIIERGKDSKWPKAYAFNTFFYPKLLKDGPSSLRRWTRRIDLFAYDIIVVPIHLGLHWCMSIIDLRNSTIRYYDSMGAANRQCLEALLRYLQAEHLDKKQAEFDVTDWELENMEDIPQQMNGSDCGMFSCTFAEFITRDAQISFSQEDMPYLRRKMVLEILDGELLIK